MACAVGLAAEARLIKVWLLIKDQHGGFVAWTQGPPAWIDLWIPSTNDLWITKKIPSSRLFIKRSAAPSLLSSHFFEVAVQFVIRLLDCLEFLICGTKWEFLYFGYGRTTEFLWHKWIGFWVCCGILRFGFWSPSYATLCCRISGLDTMMNKSIQKAFVQLWTRMNLTWPWFSQGTAESWGGEC
jgi:hypothetical protein